MKVIVNSQLGFLGHRNKKMSFGQFVLGGNVENMRASGRRRIKYLVSLYEHSCRL